MTVHHLPDLGRHCVDDGPPLDVRSWRLRRLLEAGFPVETAHRLAADRQFDLHAMLELVDHGCPPSLAVRIIDPTDPVDPVDPTDTGLAP